MYPGHFAAGLAIKAAAPRSPTFGLMIGVGLLDLLFGVFVALGWEGGGFRHLRIPWSHSLAMALLWSSLYAAVFLRMGRSVAAAMFAAVLSHWVLDALVHRPDMGLYPFSGVEIGLSRTFGGVSGWSEAVVTVALCAVYAARAREADNFGGRWVVVCLLVVALYVLELVNVPGWVRAGT